MNVNSEIYEQIDRQGRIPVVYMYFGSRLYGTGTPESDTDIKGVFIPSLEELLLTTSSKNVRITSGKDNSKNNLDDIDIELMSLHEFIRLSCEGQTMALDMLHATPDVMILSTPLWEEIVAKRSLFYQKNLNAFLGYCRTQAAKYGIKGSRLNAVKGILELLREKLRNYSEIMYDKNTIRLKAFWDEIKSLEGEYITFGVNANGIPEVEVCGRKVQNTVTIGYAMGVFNKYYENYGKRAEQASNNEGIDWKAISHAIRVALELKELYTKETITFPLKDADFIRKIKLGKLDYTTEAAPYLESAIEEIERLSKESNFRESVDWEYWDKFIIQTISKQYGLG